MEPKIQGIKFYLLWVQEPSPGNRQLVLDGSRLNFSASRQYWANENLNLVDHELLL